ncbi:MAG: gluconokinase [Bauldia sp.]|nr:gluconokinase [Bauldia sp.]
MTEDAADGNKPTAIVVMGVAGSGKTVIGEALAERLGLPMLEGDSFHPEANVRKMSSGVPLTDDDRWPWLDAIGKAIGETPGGVIAACSALKRAYRDRLTAAAGRPLLFLFLDGSREVLASRIGNRKGHFMPPGLLDSQLATLEPPGPDELTIRVDVAPPVAEVVAEALTALGSASGLTIPDTRAG